VRLGDHLCLTYGTDAEQRDVVGAFVAGGLRTGERVLYLADRTGPDDIDAWLAGRGVDGPAARVRGQLQYRAGDDGYLAGDRFTPAAVIDSLAAAVEAAHQEGYPALRVTGELGWAAGATLGAETLEDYESEVDGLFATGDLIAVCQYDRRAHHPVRLAGLIAMHAVQLVAGPVQVGDQVSITATYDPPGFAVAGSLDAAAVPALRDALAAALAGPGDVWVDLSTAAFVDVAALRMLVRAATALPTGRRLRITGARAAVLRVIEFGGWEGAPGLVVTPGEPA